MLLSSGEREFSFASFAWFQILLKTATSIRIGPFQFKFCMWLIEYSVKDSSFSLASSLDLDGGMQYHLALQI